MLVVLEVLLVLVVFVGMIASLASLAHVASVAEVSICSIGRIGTGAGENNTPFFLLLLLFSVPPRAPNFNVASETGALIFRQASQAATRAALNIEIGGPRADEKKLAFDFEEG